MAYYKELEEVTQRVIENNTKLDNCHQHDFQEVDNMESCHNLRVKCKRCGGWLERGKALWYSIGYKDGREQNEKEIKEKT